MLDTPYLHRQALEQVAGARDHRAFKLLFEYYAPRLKSFMMKSMTSPAIADDLVQETMVRVWRKAHLFNPEKAQASTWIFTIARNVRIDKLRQQSSRYFIDVNELDLEDGAACPEAVISQQQISKKVMDALNILPPDQKEVLLLSYLENLAQGEIAQRLSIPLGTVKSRMRLAYRKMRDQLGDLT